MSKTPSSDDLDVSMVMAGLGLPLAVVPISDRAKALFIRWGMHPEDEGITPPIDPSHLFESIPADWRANIVDAEDGEIKLTEVPLPQPRIVVH